jgi:chromosome segregation ATPase
MNTIDKRMFGWGAAACFAAWLALGALPAAAAGMYKWTDDQGIVHYSDQMPADAVNKGGVMMDKQGRQIKKIDATLTPAQAKLKEAEDERQRQIAKVQEDKMRRDVALTHSYTSEEEIEFARSRALQAIESQLKSAETYIADLMRRQQELKKEKIAYGTNPVPRTLDNELSGLDEELVRQDKVLAQRRAEIGAINAKYESDKMRWREIRTDQKPAAAASNTPPAAPNKASTSTVTK